MDLDPNPDPDLYQFQPNVKVNYTFATKLQYGV